jgi:hypothetical protein
VLYDPKTEQICQLCVKIVPKPHDCEVAKRLAARPSKDNAPYIHSDATPTRDLSRIR